ncbi:hypothetical protein SLEP1_g49908 [Rubroshorea leprosula]|uniref:Uncharacterized protein n=1 Tax=Rubroshorea leprosula TaxID=152421 RepID=A0AAV5M0L6_9ROSI|nr:hypothetical protein SLEP1_g49908 [Rubroshorea leprosula]
MSIFIFRLTWILFFHQLFEHCNTKCIYIIPCIRQFKSSSLVILGI